MATTDPLASAALETITKEISSGIPGTEQWLIASMGAKVIAMLLEKNRRYGSSATKPIRVFSKADPLEGIHLRMDDKLSRIRAGAADDDEDPIYDLAGYCILELVARAQLEQS